MTLPATNPAFHPGACRAARRSALRRLGACAALGAGPGLGAWLTGCASAPGPARPASGAAPQVLVLDGLRPETYRLVNRLSWGAHEAELAHCQRLGTAGYVREQLTPRPDAALPPAAAAQIAALDITRRPLAERVAELQSLRRRGSDAATEDERQSARQQYQQFQNRLVREAASRHLLRALYSPAQLQEHLSWFWLNHFNVHQFKHQVRVLLPDYEDRAIRPHALGSFRAMLGAVTRHPAMLQYLDNFQNAARRINENHARELLELHTLGVDGGYSQQDVQELARVLTGHGVRLADEPSRVPARFEGQAQHEGAYEFLPQRHDFGDKQLLGQRIAGRGAEELDQVLDLLVAHPATARYVCRKLAQYLLADEPPPALVQRMAGTFLATRGQIAPTLRVLIEDADFVQAGPGKFKDPTHYLLSAVRAAHGGQVVLNTLPLQNWLNLLGQGLYNRGTPDGWPLTAQAWNSSGQMAARFDVARAIGQGAPALFAEEGAGGAQRPVLPQLDGALYRQLLRPQWRAATVAALDRASSPQDWAALYLASPDFMQR
jgi:uncharacterized protein (DUF1800 family)